MNLALRLLRILTSLPFLCVALLGVLVWFTLSLYERAQTEAERTVPVAAVRPKSEQLGLVKQLGGKAVELAVPPPPAAETSKEIPADVRRTLLAVPAPLALYKPAAAAPVSPPAALSSRYLPFGTLVPCKLVNTVDSNADGTPLVAIVLEDMRNRDEQGTSQVVVPAGTLALLESTSPGRERDRIAADGAWVLVWRTDDEDNGLEMPVQARALAREYDAITGLYGAGDGRAGLRGVLVENLEARRMNAAAQAALQGGLAAAKQYDVTSNALTGQVLRDPIPSLRNTLLAGGEAYMQQYADQVREHAARDTAYVRVPAGTEFYLFLRQTMDLKNARRGAMASIAPKK